MLLSFAVESELKEKRQEKRGGVKEYKVRRAGALDPTVFLLVLSYVTTVHTLNCVL